MAELELEPEDHVYRLRGAEIPGCTHVLQTVGAAPTFWWMKPEELQYYRDRGHAVHKAVELTIRGRLDQRLPKWIKPYLIGWQRFCDDYNVEVIRIPSETPKEEKPNPAFYTNTPFVEVPLHHEIYRYGVTPDVVAKVKGQLTVIELKATSAHSAASEIQTAAQLLAVESVVGQSLNGVTRWACRLLPKEPYFDPLDHKERGDRFTWIGMLSTFNWLRSKKILKENHNAR